MRLAGKTALITGAGSGIGWQSAQLFAQAGAAVIAVDINEQSGRQCADEIVQSGGKAAYVHADVSRESDCQQMIAAAEATFGKLDILFNNAGISHADDDDAINTSEAVWDLTFEVNVKSVFLGCKYGIPALGGLAAAASSTRRHSWRCWARPRHSWHTRRARGPCWPCRGNWRSCMRRKNIRVNALCPGPLRTELLMKYLNTDEKKQRRLVHIPMGRFGEADEIAKAALYLASDESSFVTGSSFVVDGGITAAYVTPE